MNLFTARLTGKMLSTDAFEQEIANMLARVQRWRAIEKSPELAEYLALKKEVESETFIARKKELLRPYKETEEAQKTSLYQSLKSSLRIKGYEFALENENMQAFLAYEAKRAANPEEEIVLSRTEKFTFDAIRRSLFYKNYLEVKNSEDLKQLKALDEEIHTADFEKRNALWADEKRWQHSEDYKTEQRFLELANSDDIKFFYASREEKIDWAELFRPSFADDMSEGKNWKPGFGYANPAMKDGHSRTNEWQAYNEGKNTFFAEGRMDIETRATGRKAIAWDEKKGFVETEFDYTSDVMNTKEAFSQESGMFMAKVRSQGTGHHFFGLSTGKPGQPMIALYHYNGNKPQVGLINGDSSQMEDLSGLLPTNFFYFIYTFRWTKNELIWYVNNLEILRVPNTLPKEAMFLLAQSWLPKTEKGGEGKLKIRWAKIYKAVD